MLGLCRLLERKINLALQDVPDVAGAAVRCVPSSSGLGVRVIADFGADIAAYDASLTFTAGTPAANNALGDVKLGAANATANVGRYWLGTTRDALAQKKGTLGDDGTELPKTADLIGNEAAFTGIYALEKVDLFNLLSIPDATLAQAGNPAKLDATVSPNDIFAAAMTYCQKRRAFLLIDPPPEVNNVEAAADWKSSGLTVHAKDGAAFFPRSSASLAPRASPSAATSSRRSEKPHACFPSLGNPLRQRRNRHRRKCAHVAGFRRHSSARGQSGRRHCDTRRTARLQAAHQ